MPMSMHRRAPAPLLARRLRARLAVVAARVLATRSPARIQATLSAASRGARPASPERALAARGDVLAVSRVCRDARGCVPRSVATALLCRMSGDWPTWRVGVRTVAPFAAHAWVEAGGQLVGEAEPPGYFRPLLTVPPPHHARRAPARPARAAGPSAQPIPVAPAPPAGTPAPAPVQAATK
jgi:hypothetical protein